MSTPNPKATPKPKAKKSPNKIPEAHLEEDKDSPGEDTGEQIPDPIQPEGDQPRPRPGAPRKA